MRQTLFTLSLGLFLAITGCSASEGETTEVPATDEAQLSTPAFSGTYTAVSDDDSYLFGNDATIVRRGPKLFLKLDLDEYPLTKVRSGAYIFSGPEQWGDCDNPGCRDIVHVSGVVYLKRVGNTKRPPIKVNVRLDYPHPEEEGDLEGEHMETVRFEKR